MNSDISQEDEAEIEDHQEVDLFDPRRLLRD